MNEVQLNMTKKISIIILLTLLANFCSAQITESEKINWGNLKGYNTEFFSFISQDLKYECRNCRFVELSSLSGVSGYLVIGQSTFSVPKKDLSGSSNALLIRMSPKDSTELLKIVHPSDANDKGFVALSLLILNDVFKRSYHAGNDALIPKSGSYTANIFSDKHGDMIITYVDKKLEVFNLTDLKTK